MKKKTAKIASATRAPPTNLRFLPAAGGYTPRPPRCYSFLQYYNFVEFVSSATSVLLPLKKVKIATVDFLLLLLCTFGPIFTSNSVVFVDGGSKNISCPRTQGTLATPLDLCQIFFQGLGENTYSLQPELKSNASTQPLVLNIKQRGCEYQLFKFFGWVRRGNLAQAYQTSRALSTSPSGLSSFEKVCICIHFITVKILNRLTDSVC